MFNAFNSKNITLLFSFEKFKFYFFSYYTIIDPIINWRCMKTMYVCMLVIAPEFLHNARCAAAYLWSFDDFPFAFILSQ